MSKLLQGMVHICFYMDEQVIIIDDNFKNHMDILDGVLVCLKNFNSDHYS